MGLLRNTSRRCSDVLIALWTGTRHVLKAGHSTQRAVSAVLCLLLVPFSARAQPDEASALVTRVTDAVCGKRIVLLGELPSHGEAHTFYVKAEIVKRLIRDCGFETLLFEAPLYDFIGFQIGVEQRTATASQLDMAIGRFWWTRELSDWRQWLFEQATQGSLVLGGLDDQVSITSEYARAALPALVAESVPPQESSVCEQSVRRHLYWRYDESTPFDEQEKIRLDRCVRDAVTEYTGAEDHQGSPEHVMLESLAGYVGRQAGGTEETNREEAMYQNALWYLGRVPAGGKAIIWTAGVHAARQQGPLARQPLGARLAARWGSDLTAIGFTAYSGRSSMAGQPVRSLEKAPHGSLEAGAMIAQVPWAFLNTTILREIGQVPSRLFGGFTRADWSTIFDGVVVIREEVPPTFDDWK